VTGEVRQVPKVVSNLILIGDYISRLIWRLINPEMLCNIFIKGDLENYRGTCIITTFSHSNTEVFSFSLFQHNLTAN
jgi:hypothetical protein